MTPKTFILFGPVGCGKGTQAQMLIKHLEEQDKGNKVIYIETGEKLREFNATGGYTQEITAGIMEKGGLLPSFLPVWIWTGIFIKQLTGKEHIVLDGLSRREYEAPILHDALLFYGRENVKVIVLNISKETAVQRALKRGRSDDEVKDIETRFNWYEQNVTPAINYYRRNSYFKVIDINGEQPIEKVSADILAAVA